MNVRAVIQGIGHCVPEKKLTNADLVKMVDTTDEWIVQRTGMKERRVCGPDETTSTLCIGAAKEALDNSGITAEELDLIIVGTVTGDMTFPSTSCLVQLAIGAKNAGALDVGAACAGFIYSLSVANAMIVSGQAKTILVIGGDALTKFTDYTDRGTCILFGDGAGAVVVRGETDTDRGVIDTVLMSDGNGAKHIELAVSGSLHPACDPASANFSPYVYMAGSEVYRFAVSAMGDACLRALKESGMTVDDVDLFVPHQANLRIVESATKKIGLPQEKVFINIQKYGNTSGASIPLGLYEAVQEGRLKRGDVVMTVGFGAGLVWGANLIRW